MAKTLLTSHSNIGANAGTTYYGAIYTGNLSTLATSEAQKQRTFNSAGIISNLYCRVSVNDRGASTLTLRKNAGNGSESVSIGASTTGEFEDTSNTDSVSAGDEINYSLVTGAGGTTFTFALVSAVFSATTNTVCVLGNSGGNVDWASGTRYLPLGGHGNPASSEGRTQFKVTTAGTLKNLFVYVSTNARTTTTSIGSRIAAGNGNLVVSITASSTGIFEDTSNTDAVSSGNLCNFYITTSTGTEVLALTLVSVEFETTTNKFISQGSSANSSVSISASITYWLGLGGFLTLISATESNYSTEAQMSFDVTNMWLFVSANSITGTSTVSLRKNQVAGNNTISIAGSATGAFEDTTNTDSFVATDEINFEVAGGAGGTTMVIRVLGALFTNTDGAGGDPEGSLIGGKLIRGGLLKHGVLVGRG